MLNQQEINNLAYEIINTIDMYKIEDSFMIILPDTSYDNLDGWKNWKPNLYEYAESKDDILSDKFNMFVDGDIHTMFNTEQNTIREWKNEEYANRILKCREILYNIFQNYGLEWKNFYHGYGISFREIK